MIVRSIDLDGDWNFGKGKSDYLKDNAAVGQCINTRLKSFLGDCFFNLEAGIDWWNLLGTHNVKGTELAVKTMILNTQSVTGLLELSTELDENRAQTSSYSVTTVYTTQEPLSGTVEVP